MSTPYQSAPRAWPGLPIVALLLVLVLAATPVTASPPDRVEPRGVWPLQPEPDVVEDFDPPDTPYGRGHRGVDLAGRAGQQVRAALPGVVSWAGRLAGTGIVVVDHGATRTTYQPVADPAPVGTEVAAGDRIGTLELPASHCFPSACLHWGWRRGEVYLDPLLLVGVRPVRLLPLFVAGPASGSAAGLLQGSPLREVAAPAHPYGGWRPPLSRWRPPWADRGG